MERNNITEIQKVREKMASFREANGNTMTRIQKAFADLMECYNYSPKPNNASQEYNDNLTKFDKISKELENAAKAITTYSLRVK